MLILTLTVAPTGVVLENNPYMNMLLCMEGCLIVWTVLCIYARHRGQTH